MAAWRPSSSQDHSAWPTRPTRRGNWYVHKPSKADLAFYVYLASAFPLVSWLLWGSINWWYGEAWAASVLAAQCVSRRLGAPPLIPAGIARRCASIITKGRGMRTLATAIEAASSSLTPRGRASVARCARILRLLESSYTGPGSSTGATATRGSSGAPLKLAVFADIATRARTFVDSINFYMDEEAWDAHDALVESLDALEGAAWDRANRKALDG